MKKGKILLVVAILMSFSLLGEAAPNYADPVTFTGRLQRDEEDFYVSGVEMELGDSYTVGADYNKDGQLAVIKRELWMMTNQQVTIQGYRDTKAKKNIVYVTAINGMAYPNTKVDQAQVKPLPGVRPDELPDKEKGDGGRDIKSDIPFQLKKKK